MLSRLAEDGRDALRQDETRVDGASATNEAAGNAVTSTVDRRLWSSIAPERRSAPGDSAPPSTGLVMNSPRTADRVRTAHE
jgi:hypothetical protein